MLTWSVLMVRLVDSHAFALSALATGRARFFLSLSSFSLSHCSSMDVTRLLDLADMNKEAGASDER